MKKIIVVLVALLAFGLTTQAKGDKKKKQPKQVEVVVDTVPNLLFSYAYGVANTQGLKGFLAMRQGVDTLNQMAAFMRGFDGGAENDLFLAAIKAYLAGAEVRQQLDTQMIRQIDKRLTGCDTLSLIDRAAFVDGFRQAVIGQASMDEDSAIAIVDKNSKYHIETLMEAKYGDWKRENIAFLAQNAKNDSVKTTDSGLQYKVLTMGDGATPVATDKVKVQYEGRLIDGFVFDSSYKRQSPATFGCNQVIKGWTEALTMMPVGSKWELYIPQELAYGEREQGKIKPFSALVFTVELLEIVK